MAEPSDDLQQVPEEHSHDDLQRAVTPIPDDDRKRRTRQRLLRGLSRMSSSSSLISGRARSASTPVSKSGASMSCLALDNDSAFDLMPASPPAPSTPYDLRLPTSSSSTQPFPPFPHSQSSNAINITSQSTSALHSAAAGSQDMVRTVSLPLALPRRRKTLGELWNCLPHELQLRTLKCLQPKEVIRLSRVNKKFHSLCFDGQMWTNLDATEFYQDIPVEMLAKIMQCAGPFVKDLNLRGCIQVDKLAVARQIARASGNIINASLEHTDLCSNSIAELIVCNEKLQHINLAGIKLANNDTCGILAETCTRLEVLNLSWCKSVTAVGIETVVSSCPKLRDLRVSEIRGFDNTDIANTFFRTNQLERLVFSGCTDLSDRAFKVMLHGIDPEMDLLTDRPIVPPRRLRYLDLSRCTRLSDDGVSALGYCVPDLEGLILGGCTTITAQALEPILESTPKLTHLDLEDLVELKNPLFSQCLARAPCAKTLQHLSVSYCDDVGDAGMVPVFRACTNLRSVEMDNTRITDFTLLEAAVMVRQRAKRTRRQSDGDPAPALPRIALNLVVYDCPGVTPTGVREILSGNELVSPRGPCQTSPDTLQSTQYRHYPNDIISLKCYYDWQMTVDEHTKRVLRGQFRSARRLHGKWAASLQAAEEANANGPHSRRRRRRAREARQAHAEEEAAEAGAGAGPIAGGQGSGIGRRRARTATCAIM